MRLLPTADFPWRNVRRSRVDEIVVLQLLLAEWGIAVRFGSMLALYERNFITLALASARAEVLMQQWWGSND